MTPPNSTGVNINGKRYPWPVILFIVAIISNGAVTLYKIDAMATKAEDHETRIRALERSAHPHNHIGDR